MINARPTQCTNPNKPSEPFRILHDGTFTLAVFTDSTPRNPRLRHLAPSLLQILQPFSRFREILSYTGQLAIKFVEYWHIFLETHKQPANTTSLPPPGSLALQFLLL